MSMLPAIAASSNASWPWLSSTWMPMPLIRCIQPKSKFSLVCQIGNNDCVVEVACPHQRVPAVVALRMNIGPSVEQKRDCLKASPPSSLHDRCRPIFLISPLHPCPSLEQKGCLGPVLVTARPPQLLVQVCHPLLPVSSLLSSSCPLVLRGAPLSNPTLLKLTLYSVLGQHAQAARQAIRW